MTSGMKQQATRRHSARLGLTTSALALMVAVAGCSTDSSASTPTQTSAEADTATPTPDIDVARATDDVEQTQGPDATAAMPEEVATATSTLNVPVRPNAVLTGEGLVLQVDDDPPVLCLAPYIETYPPECDGPLLLGLDWDEMPPNSLSQGIRWGQAAVVGTFDGATFTLIQPPSPPATSASLGAGVSDQELATICDSPYADGEANGLDPLSEEGERARAEAVGLLEGGDEYASSFTSDGASVLNVLLTEDGDAEATAAALREVWPGGLCVEARGLPAREAVYRAMDKMSRANLPDVFSWTAAADGGIEIIVLRADEDMIIQLYSVLDTLLDQDDIHITSALNPLDPQPRR